MLMEKLQMSIPTFKVVRQIQLVLKDCKIYAKEAELADERQTFLKSHFCFYEPDSAKQLIQMTFDGQYNENYLILEVPTELLIKSKSL